MTKETFERAKKLRSEIASLESEIEQEPDKIAERIILVKTCKSCPNVFPQIKGGYRCISLGINGYDLKEDIDTRCPLSTIREYARQSQINLRDELQKFAKDYNTHHLLWITDDNIDEYLKQKDNG